MSEQVAGMRRAYKRVPLDEDVVPAEPLTLFLQWFDDAVAGGVLEPNAMVLATADGGGRPSARFVLLKGVDERGFAFYTNLASRKARELATSPFATLCFGWLEIERQVRIDGAVEQVGRDETRDYWASRPRESQLSAWVSPQSAVIGSREVLEQGVTAAAARFEGEVPLPDSWGGFRIVPDVIEFWQGGPGRLHDRLRYTRRDGAWVIERLAP